MNKIKHLLYPLIPFLIVAGVYIFGSVLDKTEFSTKGGTVKVRSGALVYPDFGNGKQSPYPAGDSVQFFGYYQDRFDAYCLVKTENGLIGDLPMWNLDIPLLATGGPYKGDTIRLIPPKKYGEYKGTPIIDRKTEVFGLLPNGEKTEDLWKGDFCPDVPDFVNLKISEGINRSFTKLMSKDKFDSLINSLELNSAESKLGPILASAKNGDNGIMASFHTFVFNPETGQFYRPVITFNADSSLSSVELIMERERADWLLKRLPLADKIYDWPLTSFFARSNLYLDLNDAPGFMSFFDKVWSWVKWAIKLIGCLIWFFCFTYIPIWVLNYILENFPAVFSFIPNVVMKALYILIIAVFAYYWMLVTLAWGMYWIFIPVQIIVAVGVYYNYTSVFQDYIPHARCPQCRYVHTMQLVDSKLMDSYTTTEDTTKTKETGTEIEKTTTWIEKTNIHGQKSRENIHVETDTTTHYKHDHYEDLVKKHQYLLHFECSHCGFKESMYETKTTLLNRTHVGSSSSSETKHERR